jgi:hypothetical protein
MAHGEGFNMEKYGAAGRWPGETAEALLELKVFSWRRPLSGSYGAEGWQQPVS